MSNQKKEQEKENNFKILVIDIEVDDINFHISANTCDGSVIIVVNSIIHEYFKIKYFIDSKSAEEWIKSVLESVRIVNKFRNEL